MFLIRHVIKYIVYIHEGKYVGTSVVFTFCNNYFSVLNFNINVLFVSTSVERWRHFLAVRASFLDRIPRRASSQRASAATGHTSRHNLHAHIQGDRRNGDFRFIQR